MQELDQLRLEADPDRAARSAARHKRGRETLGLSPARIEALASEWRGARDLDARIALSRALWDSDIHEARLIAARLLVQARMRPDQAVWDTILNWAPQIDGLDIGDAVMTAAARRLVADPARLDQIAAWAKARNRWLRRSVLVATLPWARMANPKSGDLAIREQVLDMALDLATDSHGAVRQAVQLWMQGLAKHDPDRVAVWRDRLADLNPAGTADEPEVDPDPDTALNQDR